MKEKEKEISFVGHASFFLQRTLAAVVCNWGWLLKGQEKEEWGGGEEGMPSKHWGGKAFYSGENLWGAGACV